MDQQNERDENGVFEVRHRTRVSGVNPVEMGCRACKPQRTVETVTAGHVAVTFSRFISSRPLLCGGDLAFYVERFQGGSHHLRCNLRFTEPQTQPGRGFDKNKQQTQKKHTYMWVQFLARSIERRRPRRFSRRGDGELSSTPENAAAIDCLDDAAAEASDNKQAESHEGKEEEEEEEEEVFFYKDVGQDYWLEFGKNHFDQFPDVRARGGERRFLLPLSPSSNPEELVWGVDTVHKDTPEYGGRRTVGGTPPPYASTRAAAGSGSSHSGAMRHQQQCVRKCSVASGNVAKCFDLSRAALGAGRAVHEMWDAPQHAFHLLVLHRQLLNDEA